MVPQVNRDLQGVWPGEEGRPEGTLHILSDIATPHNNCLISATRKLGVLKIITWYAHRSSSEKRMQTPNGDSNNFFFDTWTIRARLLITLLRHKHDHILLVGYSNLITKTVLIWSVIFRRRFMFWLDQPEARSAFSSWPRALAYRFVRHARPVFVVGERTKEWFIARGFHPATLVNLPIFVEVPKEVPDEDRRAHIRNTYGVPKGLVLVVGASRLLWSKGYDLLIQAIGRLDASTRATVHVLIVGNGPEWDRLECQIAREGLTAQVRLVQWLSPNDYVDLISAADIFAHPARFDAFGGGTLNAMAYGVPVIGSEGAGTVVERIQHEVNGLRYPAANVEALAGHLFELSRDKARRERLGQAARATAISWSPARGAQLLTAATLDEWPNR